MMETVNERLYRESQERRAKALRSEVRKEALYTSAYLIFFTGLLYLMTLCVGAFQ